MTIVKPQDIKTAIVRIGGYNASTNRYIFKAPQRCFIRKVSIISDTSTTASDGTNRWVYQVANVTASNNLLATAINTNTNGEMTADTPYAVNPTQNGLILENAVLQLQITKSSSPTSLASAEVDVIVEYTITDTSEV